jgi:predicted transporter
MIELTAESLLISIILLFGINIGLAMGLSKESKKNIAIITVSYGILISLLMFITGIYDKVLYNSFNLYLPEIIGILGFVTVLSGIYTILQWKKNKTEYGSLFSLGSLSSLICALVGILSICAISENSFDSSYLGYIGISFTLILIILASHSFSSFLRKAERPYPVVLGNFMILNGFYFLIAAAFIPNIGNLSTVQMSPFTIESTASLFFMIMALLGVLLLGVYLQNRYFENRTNIEI